MEHRDIPEGEQHVLANWTVDSTLLRDALSVSYADVGKVCRVRGDQCYVLANSSPMEWETLTAVPAAVAVAYHVADSVALAALSVTADDVGKLARQADTGRVLELASVSPSVWVGVDTYALARSVHTGTQLASTVSDFKLATLQARADFPALFEDFVGGPVAGHGFSVTKNSDMSMAIAATVAGMLDAHGVATFTITGLVPSFTLEAALYAGTGGLELSAEPIGLVMSFAVTNVGSSGDPLVTTISLFNSATNKISLSVYWNRVEWECVQSGSITSGSAAMSSHANTRITLAILATSTSVSFYKNGTLLGTVSATIPTVALYALGNGGSAGVTAHSCVWGVDFIALYRKFSTPRSITIP